MPRLPLPLLILAAGPLAAQPVFEVPKAVPPDAATLTQIEAKLAELNAAVAALPKSLPADVRADVEVYAKAGEWVTRHGEWYTKDTAKQTLVTLGAGLARAKAAAGGQAPWRDVRNKPVIRGYRSAVDGSVQPYSVTVPEGLPADVSKWRLDVVLHGRDQTLTEVKFIAGKEGAKPGTPAGFIVLEPYGRGNNAYRWAGEADVWESVASFLPGVGPSKVGALVLRGFSMGGAGSWHIGLHHPGHFAVIGPGAGFTTTRGYIKGLPDPLPDYQEKCLTIYDAVRYAENALNVPVVAYSGSKDPQKAAADNIENALKDFKEPLRFTHIVAPGLEHQMPPEWMAKAQAEYAKYAVPGREPAERVRFVTYTTRYNRCDWVEVLALDEHYRKSVVDARRTKDGIVATTENVRAVAFRLFNQKERIPVTIDGQTVAPPDDNRHFALIVYVKKDGKWAAQASRGSVPGKSGELSGPIDDAFTRGFRVSGPSGKGWTDATDKYHAANLARFGAEWDKFFRGKLPNNAVGNAVLFGDPESNVEIGHLLPSLPIIWTRDKLVVNGVEYDAKTHVPALIYPHPDNTGRYVVINSGHTFHAAELNGTNAQLYPRLGDWAVLKPTPTAKDPAAAEVVAAGLFDEQWQFPKK